MEERDPSGLLVYDDPISGIYDLVHMAAKDAEWIARRPHPWMANSTLNEVERLTRLIFEAIGRHDAFLAFHRLSELAVIPTGRRIGGDDGAIETMKHLLGHPYKDDFFPAAEKYIAAACSKAARG